MELFSFMHFHPTRTYFFRRTTRTTVALRAKLNRIVVAPLGTGECSGTRGGKSRAKLVTVDPRMHLTGPYLAPARRLVAGRWDMCNAFLIGATRGPRHVPDSSLGSGNAWLNFF